MNSVIVRFDDAQFVFVRELNQTLLIDRRPDKSVDFGANRHVPHTRTI